MREDRLMIDDALWARMEGHLPCKVTDCGVTGRDNRLFMEAVLWRVRTGSPWRDLPVHLGPWNTTFQRFRRWARSGVFERLLDYGTEIGPETQISQWVLKYKKLVRQVVE